MKIRIENDLFGIAERLRNIDSDYVVYYDNCSRKFELHNMRFRPTLQIIFPYQELDKRAVDYTLKTQVDKILKEILSIDEHNQKIIESREASLIDEVTKKLESAIRYIDRGGDDLPEYSRL